MEKSIEERIELLEKCANLYETDGTSPLTDAEYDEEYYALKEIVPDHPFFSSVGGLDLDHVYGELVKHDVVMGSLLKSANPDDYREWFNDHVKHDTMFLIEPKVDGASLSLIYNNGKLVRAVTRGDGITGVDVTNNAKYVDGIKNTIGCKEEVEIRGEVYKDKKDFFENWAVEYANPRNFASGSLNQKDPLVTKERGLSFIAYEVLRKEFKTQEEKGLFLVSNEFHTLMPYITVINGRDLVCDEVEHSIKNMNRELLPFEVDGIVVKVNDLSLLEEYGYVDNGKRSKINRAVKFPTEKKVTKLIDVEWAIKRTGKLNCTAILEPVELAGTTVQRATLHNPKFIESMGIDLNCEVKLQKSGDIIPYILGVSKKGTNPIVIPTDCPSCGSELEWDDNHVTKWCQNVNCMAKLNSNIEHWFKKLGVKGIGEGIINKLTSKKYEELDPYVSSLSEMYELNKCEEELEDLFGRKAFSNIQKSVFSITEMPLAKFIEALGIGQIGRMASDITDIAPTIEDVDKLTVEDIVKIDGFAEKKAKSFVEGWKNLRSEIDKLLKFVSIKEVEMTSDKLKGKKICFTGSFKNPTRKEMEQMVIDNGGKKGSVGKSLDYLVWDGEISGSKVDKAKKLGLSIISQDDFINMIK